MDETRYTPQQLEGKIAYLITQCKALLYTDDVALGNALARLRHYANTYHSLTGKYYTAPLAKVLVRSTPSLSPRPEVYANGSQQREPTEMAAR